MHSPIVYFTKQKDQTFNLNDADEKDTFMQDVYPSSMDEEFGDYVPSSDYWTININADGDWYRGEWEIAELMQSMLNEATNRQVDLQHVTDGVVSFTLTPDDVTQYINNELKQIHSLVEEFKASIDKHEGDNQALTMDMSLFKYRVSRSEDTGLKLLNLENGGSIENLSELFQEVMYADSPQTYYVYTSIQGDYHY